MKILLVLVLVSSLFLSTSAIAENTYSVNQDCYFGVSYDALVKATLLAGSGDYEGVRQMEAQGLIFMPNQGWEVIIKLYKNNGLIVCVSPVNGSGSFWGFKDYITKVPK
jgi:hypothetical protein